MSWRVLLLVGWFFSVRTVADNGLQVVSTVGAFKTKAACEAYRDGWVAEMANLGISLEQSPCLERKAI